MGGKNRPTKQQVFDDNGAVTLSPDEERACETIARIIAKMQARVRAESAASKAKQRREIADA